MLIGEGGEVVNGEKESNILAAELFSIKGGCR